MKTKAEGVKPLKAVKVDKVLERYKKITQTRYKLACQVYEAQDGITREVIDRIRDRLTIASTGVVAVNGKPYRIDQKYIDYNILFLACEILSDLALFGIQIANFEPSALFCMECRKPLELPRDYKREREVKKARKK